MGDNSPKQQNLDESVEEDTEQSDEKEDIVQPEVVDSREIQPEEEVEALSTFSEQEGPFSYKIIPEISRAGSNWKVIVYMDGVQGPVYQSNTGITDGAAEQIGLSRRLQDRINDALDYAAENLEVPSELGNQERNKRSLHELEVLMEDA